MYCKYTKTINISKYVRDIQTYTKIYKIPTSRRLLKLARKWDRVEVKHIWRMAIGCKKQIIKTQHLLLPHPLTPSSSAASSGGAPNATVLASSASWSPVGLVQSRHQNI